MPRSAAGFQDPDSGGPQRKILPRGRHDDPIQPGIVEGRPPRGILARPALDAGIAGIIPAIGHRGLGRGIIWPHLAAVLAPLVHAGATPRREQVGRRQEGNKRGRPRTRKNWDHQEAAFRPDHIFPYPPLNPFFPENRYGLNQASGFVGARVEGNRKTVDSRQQTADGARIPALYAVYCLPSTVYPVRPPRKKLTPLPSGNYNQERCFRPLPMSQSCPCREKTPADEPTSGALDRVVFRSFPVYLSGLACRGSAAGSQSGGGPCCGLGIRVGAAASRAGPLGHAESGS